MARAGEPPPLVGRTAQLGRLQSAVQDAAEGRPGAVLVSGDAGVGKTRLVTEQATRAEAGGARVLIGHCVDLGDAGVPYLPFAEALAPLAADPAAPRALAGWLAGAAPGPAGDSGVGQLQLFDAVLTALEPPPGCGPTLLILEDLHWADRSSRDLLAFLIRRLRAQRLLVVGTVRTDDLHRRHPLRPLLAELSRLPVVERVSVEPFTGPEMAEYVAALTGRSPTPAVVDGLLGRSEGNPYFAEQLLACAPDGAAPGLPGAIADVVLSRVEALPDDARTLVRAAAVAPGRVTHDLLVGVSGLPAAEVDRALREAVAAHVLVPSGDGYAFRHALAREAVYADLLPGEQVRLHSTFAALLEDGAYAADRRSGELAHHRMASHDLAGALTASVQAAKEATVVLAPAEALQHLERALQLWDAVDPGQRPPDHDAVTLGLSAATAARHAGDPQRAAALSREAARRADAGGDPQRVVPARRALAVALLAADRPDQALAVVEETLARQSDPATPVDLAWLDAIAARSLGALGHVPESTARAEQSLRLARASGAGDVEADALVTLAAVRGGGDAGADAVPLLQEALRLAQTTGNPAVELRVAYGLAVTRYESGAVVHALADVDAAVLRAEELGLSWSEYGLELRVLQVLLRYACGDFAGSRRLAELAGSRPSQAVLARITAAAVLAAVAAGDDDAGTAITRLEGAWNHDGQIAMLAGGAGAELLAWQGDPAAALSAVDRAIEHVARVWEPWFLGGIWLSAIGLAAAGDLAERARTPPDDAARAAAVQAGSRLLERARLTAEHGHPRGGRMGPEGIAWLARAEAEWSRVTGEHDPPAWRRAFDAAQEAVQGVDGYEPARCRWRLAEALAATGDREEAAREAGLAVDSAARLGARPLHRALTALVSRARLDAVNPALPHDRRTSTGALTARENQVLALLAEGLTNREAGVRLFVSEKTVSVHVSNLMAKLGARSRTEAVALASSRGLLSPPAARR